MHTLSPLCCVALLSFAVAVDAGGDRPHNKGMLVFNAGGRPAMEDLLGALGQTPGQTSSSGPSSLADLLGTGQPTTSTSSAGAFADLLSQPVPSNSPQFEPITAYEKDGIRVVFRLSKPAGQDSVTDIEALYSNTSGQPVTDFSLQVGLEGYVMFMLSCGIVRCALLMMKGVLCDRNETGCFLPLMRNSSPGGLCKDKLY